MTVKLSIKYFTILFIAIGLAQNAAAGGAPNNPNWAVTQFSLFQGNNYAIGPNNKMTLRLSEANSWKYGDNYFFFDVTQPFSDGTSIYGEWKPRLSLSKLTGRDFHAGIISDVLVAGEMNFGGRDARAYLIGIGFNLKFPKFKFVKFNIYARRDPSYKGSTYQFSWAWNLPISLTKTRLKLVFDGYADWTGQQALLKNNFLTQPRLMLDLGALAFKKAGHLYAGCQYVYWNNKFGHKDIVESEFEPVITWQLLF